MKDCDFKTWVRAAVIRALRSIAQAAIATIGTAEMMHDVNWMMIISASLMTGLVSLLTSIAGLPETKGHVVDSSKSPPTA